MPGTVLWLWVREPHPNVTTGGMRVLALSLWFARAFAWMLTPLLLINPQCGTAAACIFGGATSLSLEQPRWHR